MKESISAIESLCKILDNDQKSTLSDVLKKFEREGKLHPALAKSFERLYGYTGDADGIRNGLIDDASNLTVDDARYMLVSCSAFTNYMIAKFG